MQDKPIVRDLHSLLYVTIHVAMLIINYNVPAEIPVGVCNVTLCSWDH